MPKSLSTKPKIPPWIPPGKGIPQYKKPVKFATKIKADEPAPPEISPKKTLDISKEETCLDDVDVISLSSHSSHGHQDEADIHYISILKEMKLLYPHFASVKTSYLSAHRLIDSQDIEDSIINDLFFEVDVGVKKLNELFDDLEYSVSVLENTLNEAQKKAEYCTVYGNKENLLLRLLNMYDKVILIFQTIFDKQDFREMSQLLDSLSNKLKLTEKKCITHEAVIRDLERKLSICQGKSNSMESYKENLERAKADLEKQLLHKESQIKYLSNALMNASVKQPQSDHEEFIEIIEAIKSKSHTEKSALKKALKFQKTQLENIEKNYQKLVHEVSEKDKNMFEIAAQRDQLKVQLTVMNNNIIQQNTEIEGMKIKHLKLQNELTENDALQKKEIMQLKNSLEEKSSELDKSSKQRIKLKETIEELESELKKSNEQFKALKEKTGHVLSLDRHKSKEADVMSDEIHHLVSLLQSTREIFERLEQSSRIATVSGDRILNVADFNSVQNDILAALKETKEHLLELKKLYKAFPQEQKGIPETKDYPKKNDLEKQLKKMEQLFNAAQRENQSLKQEVEELKNSSIAKSTSKKTENQFTNNMPSDNFTRKLQLELVKKDDEIVNIKTDAVQKEKDLTKQLKECKDRLITMESDSRRLLSMEEELKNTKLELAVLQKKKDEETERLLHRTKELQDSFDLKSVEFENLQRFVQLLKSSYFNVFGDS